MRSSEEWSVLDHTPFTILLFSYMAPNPVKDTSGITTYRNVLGWDEEIKPTSWKPFVKRANSENVFPQMFVQHSQIQNSMERSVLQNNENNPPLPPRLLGYHLNSPLLEKGGDFFFQNVRVVLFHVRRDNSIEMWGFSYKLKSVSLCRCVNNQFGGWHRLPCCYMTRDFPHTKQNSLELPILAVRWFTVVPSSGQLRGDMWDYWEATVLWRAVALIIRFIRFFFSFSELV